MITRALIILNVLAYVWELYTGALRSDAALIRDGVLTPQLVLQYHEWWRIITSAFLHGGIAHIGLNMLSLYWLGRFIEAVLGSPRMLLVYMVSLVVSGLTIVFFSAYNVPTLGASGAIFGLFGALFAIGIKLGDRGTDLVRSNIGILVLNLIFSFTFPGISWQAHVGGLFAGFLTTLLVFWPPRPVYTPVYDSQSGTPYQSQVEMPDDQRH
ncbi:MAG TPA: rhomboid family intramembrane serine protease [Candidatus Baltobacteraceae bacterium]|nr:rhomboid family intramembrane serine protease [Candidatus Baltobacteraceae bacterium]